MRQILNGILYVLRSGGAWRLLLHDYPPWSTAYDYFRKWRNAGVWEPMVRTLRERLRVQAGYKATPSAAIIDVRPWSRLLMLRLMLTRSSPFSRKNRTM